MVQRLDSMDRLRAGWQRQWVRESGRLPERSTLLDIHAVLHAASQLLAPRIPAADIAELLFVHEERGRRGDSELVGEIAVTAQLVQRVLSPPDPIGCVVPVMAGAGAQPLRVERSRPGWHLNGEVRDIDWSPGADSLAVFAIDEGDNDVLMVIAPDAQCVKIAESASGATVDICFDDVPLTDVTHCAGEPAWLADILTVLAMADVMGAAGWLLGRPGADAELQLCRAALSTAAASLTAPSVVRRQHDVSAAALLVLSTCLRVADESPARDQESLRRARRIREQMRALPAWHRDRLLALV